MNTSSTTKGVILQAAFEVFLEKGMDGAGTQEIAGRAGVNKAMLYYYFDSKEDLFVEVFRKAIEESGISSIDVLEEEAPLFDKISKYIDLFTDRMLEQPATIVFVMNELNRHSRLLKEVFVQEIEFHPETLSRQLAEAAGRYEIARIDAGQLLTNILTLCMGPIINSEAYSVILGYGEEEYTEFLDNRKGTIYDMVVGWLTT